MLSNDILAVLPENIRLHMITALWVSWKDVQELIANMQDDLNGFIDYLCAYNPNAPEDYVREHAPKLYRVRFPTPKQWSVFRFTDDRVSIDEVMRDFRALPKSIDDIRHAYKLYSKVRLMAGNGLMDVQMVDAFIRRLYVQYPQFDMSDKRKLKTKFRFLSRAKRMKLADFISLLTDDELTFYKKHPHYIKKIIWNSEMGRNTPLPELLALGIPMHGLIYNNNITMADVLACDPEKVHWAILSSNPVITLATIKQHPNLPWDMDAFCANSILMLEDVRELIRDGFESTYFLFNTFKHYRAARKITHFFKRKSMYPVHIRRIAEMNRILTPRISCGYVKDVVASFLLG
jgi:hypothetical protein